MMVWYLASSLDPELLVAVAWAPTLSSFVGRIQGLPSQPLAPDHSTVVWFGRRPGELPTVHDLQNAIGPYTVLGGKLRAALEADRARPHPQPRSRSRRTPGGAARCGSRR